MAYTKGPWRVGSYTKHGPIVTENGTRVATAALMRDLTETDANANLIAAAPELLDALNAIVEGGRMNENSRVQYLVEIARAAIAKATCAS